MEPTMKERLQELKQMSLEIGTRNERVRILEIIIQMIKDAKQPSVQAALFNLVLRIREGHN